MDILWAWLPQLLLLAVTLVTDSTVVDSDTPGPDNADVQTFQVIDCHALQMGQYPLQILLTRSLVTYILKYNWILC